MERMPDNFDAKKGGGHPDDSIEDEINKLKELIEEMDHCWEQWELDKEVENETEAIDRAMERYRTLKEYVASNLRRDDVSPEEADDVREKSKELVKLVNYVKERLEIHDAAKREASDKQLIKDSQSP